MKKEEIICGEDNYPTFKHRLRSLLPDFMPVLKAFFDAGLIDGMRGAKLTVGDHVPEPGNIIESKEAEKHCKDCIYWQRDQIGDGTGVGRCLENRRPGLLKWPEQLACFEFEENK